ncbi:MAG: hypothetical protein A2Z71_10060 [Chloroflexi bacterium RBG_13_50_21]|nr:MAG: hypothetical protein A2Z71_10060 [Chloroflexi bacterium RBG_13_50_21]
MKNISVLFTNAYHIGFNPEFFDIVLSGFMGWYDCFDFEQNVFTQPDSKSREIYRVLRERGKLVICSWEAQQDLAWMENSMLHYFPDLIKDQEYLNERPIGMAYEKPAGYEIIFQAAGFKDIQVSRETIECISTDEQEWWSMMSSVGWKMLFDKIERAYPGHFSRIKEAIFQDLHAFIQSDGIHFAKSVFYVSGEK